MRPITIPDVLPSDLPDGVNFSLVAGQLLAISSFLHFNTTLGDFEEIYGTQNDANEPQSGQWDAVLTCFFIDTVLLFCPTLFSFRNTHPRLTQAKNIASYLRIIHSILAPGGVWINMGTSRRPAV
jgi:carnosine N-methyltransferase